MEQNAQGYGHDNRGHDGIGQGRYVCFEGKEQAED